MIEAINGIGHAAIATEPEFRAALAKAGFTMDPETGELQELVTLHIHPSDDHDPSAPVGSEPLEVESPLGERLREARMRTIRACSCAPRKRLAELHLSDRARSR